MHTMDQLRQAMPQEVSHIRRSRVFTKAAIIATGVQATRTMVVTTALEAGEDYHIIHVVDCGPRDVEKDGGVLEQAEELRAYYWNDLLRVIESFLQGASIDHLIEVAAGRAK